MAESWVVLGHPRIVTRSGADSRREDAPALQRGPGDASAACAEDLRAGAQVVFEREMVTSDLAPIFGRRARLFQARGGIQTIGLVEAADALTRTGHDRLRVFAVETTGPRYQFLVLVLVAPQRPRLSHASGVSHPTKREHARSSRRANIGIGRHAGADRRRCDAPIGG